MKNQRVFVSDNPGKSGFLAVTAPRAEFLDVTVCSGRLQGKKIATLDSVEKIRLSHRVKVVNKSFLYPVEIPGLPEFKI